ncbi:ABC transporter substrate-binding protein [Sporichthya polymorpha]|uniref:ABC transporter substrate-binding protein n=1 Tax=Sporichthya polymorpha TaxID=35751 RepID=UPI000A03F397|nr:ABC transporter substrate-binding protein [Sporichthya polymorpha]
MKRTRAQVWSATAVVCCLALLLAGCGTRRTHDELKTALVDQFPTAAGSQLAPGAVTDPGTTPAQPQQPAAPEAPAPGATTAPGAVATTAPGTNPNAGGPKPAATTKAQPGAGATGGGSGRPCTGTEKPIVLGSVGQQSGIAGAVTMNGPKAVSAWVASVNAAGGLACHQVRYLIADDGGSPAKHAAQVQQLVERDGVIAFVQMNPALSWSGSEKYLVAKKIPVIGTDTSYDMVYNHPNFFPQASSGKYSVQASIGAASTSFSPEAKANFGVLSCQEIAACTYLADNAKSLADLFGLTLKYSGRVSITQPDYTSVCVAAKNAGVKGLFVILDANSVHRFARSCTSVQYKPQIITPGTGVTPSMTGDPNLEGFFQSLMVAPFTDPSIPGVKEMKSVLTRFAPGLDHSGQTAVGWVSAKLVEHASQFFPAKDSLTSADVLASMYRVKNFTAGGMTAPLTYTQGENAKPFVCWASTTIRNGAWATASKWTCKK